MTSLDMMAPLARPIPAALRSAPVLFAATLFVSALLLFAVQPMFTKMVLPRLGGSPSVWSVAMVAFQTFLFIGYVYAHVLRRALPPRRAAMVHFGFLAVVAASLPLGIAAGYLTRLAPNGAIVVHISNRHMELASVVAAVGAAAGLVAHVKQGDQVSDFLSDYRANAKVAVLAKLVADLGDLPSCAGWRRFEPVPGIADDQQYGVTLLRAVVVDLLAEVGHERACRHGHRAVGIEFGAGADPPRSLDDRDAPVVGMKVRTAHVAGLPFGEHDIHAGLRRIAVHDGLLDAKVCAGLPRNLVGQLEGNGGGIEFGGRGRPQQTDDDRRGDDAARHETSPECHRHWAKWAEAPSLAEIHAPERVCAPAPDALAR